MFRIKPRFCNTESRDTKLEFNKCLENHIAGSVFVLKSYVAGSSARDFSAQNQNRGFWKNFYKIGVIFDLGN